MNFPITLQINSNEHPYVNLGDYVSALKMNTFKDLYYIVHSVKNSGKPFYINSALCQMIPQSVMMNRNNANVK